MTEIADIKGLINCSSEKNPNEIIGGGSVSGIVSEDKTESSKGFTPLKAEIGADYQSMS